MTKYVAHLVVLFSAPFAARFHILGTALNVNTGLRPCFATCARSCVVTFLVISAKRDIRVSQISGEVTYRRHAWQASFALSDAFGFAGSGLVYASGALRLGEGDPSSHSMFNSRQ